MEGEPLQRANAKQPKTPPESRPVDDPIDLDRDDITEEELQAFKKAIPFAVRHFGQLFCSQLDPNHPADKLVIEYLAKQKTGNEKKK